MYLKALQTWLEAYGQKDVADRLMPSSVCEWQDLGLSIADAGKIAILGDANTVEKASSFTDTNLSIQSTNQTFDTEIPIVLNNLDPT